VWLFIGAVWDNGPRGEGKTGARAFVPPTEKEHKIAQPNTVRDESSLVSQVVETTVDEQKQTLERGLEKVDILAGQLTPSQRSDGAQGKAAQAPQSAPASERKQALEHEQEWDRAEALARALTSSLREELDAARSAAEAARIKQKQSLDQERGRADALARELSSLRAELDTARIAGSQAVQAAGAEVEQKQALKQERDRAEALARELTSLRAELDTTRAAGLEAARTAEAAKIEQELAFGKERDKAETLARELASARKEAEARSAAAGAEVEQKQALKQELDRADALARELTSLRAELDTTRAAGLEAARTAETAKIEQELAFGKERDRAETLARELASARKEAEARSARLAAAHAEVLQATEKNTAIAAGQKLALASERDRADALMRELTSVRNELEAATRKIAALNAPRALHSRQPAVDSSQQRTAESSSSTIEGKESSPQQISGEAVASNSGGSSASELPRTEPQSSAREAASDLDPKVAVRTERSTSASAVSHSFVDEQRLLARANALLLQADISAARPLLEHALERGSARAAFMLAETYDARVLQSWRARGISGDLAKARELYQRAQAGGIEDAKERIETLK
jgi:hypothetical protein